MVRPRTEVGTSGKIQCREIRKKTKGKPAVWEARATFRMRDGTTRRPTRRGPTETAAINRLKKAMTTLADEVRGTKISGTTRIEHLAKLWLEDFEKKIQRGERGHHTLTQYRSVMKTHILPRLKEMTCAELERDVAACNDAIQGARGGASRSSATQVKTVLKGMCAFAILHKAMLINPVLSVERIETTKAQRKKQENIVVIEAEDRLDFRNKFVAAVADKVRTIEQAPKRRASSQPWRDLPDVVDGLLSTSVRIGELLALSEEEIDLKEGTVFVGWHLVRVTGVGMVRVEGRKGGEDDYTMDLPSWSMPMWRRRVLAAHGPLFPSLSGLWSNPTHVGAKLKAISTTIGYPEVASHILRHTVGTHLGESGLTDEEIAKRLGNTAKVVREHYNRRKKVVVTNKEMETMFGDAKP